MYCHRTVALPKCSPLCCTPLSGTLTKCTQPLRTFASLCLHTHHNAAHGGQIGTTACFCPASALPLPGAASLGSAERRREARRSSCSGKKLTFSRICDAHVNFFSMWSLVIRLYLLWITYSFALPINERWTHERMNDHILDIIFQWVTDQPNCTVF